MASKTVVHSDSIAELPEFFKLDGRYLIAPSTTAANMAADIRCLLGSAIVQNN